MISVKSSQVGRRQLIADGQTSLTISYLNSRVVDEELGQSFLAVRWGAAQAL
jgi:hypothetical protein